MKMIQLHFYRWTATAIPGFLVTRSHFFSKEPPVDVLRKKNNNGVAIFENHIFWKPKNNNVYVCIW